QDRTLPPHPRRRLGLHTALQIRISPPSSTPALAALLQSTPAPYRHRQGSTHHEVEQPPWALHLEARGLISRSYRTTAAGLRTSDLYHLHLSGDTMSGDTMSSELAPPAETSGDMTSMPTRHGVAQTAREVHENLHRWDDDFELFYAEYPKRVDRAESKAAWARVMARGIAPEYVIRAARRYAELKEERYAEKSARWLEGDWWPPLAAEWLRDDVRAAKARGCLPKDAPEDVLPDAARGCLEDARARWRAENVERGA